MIDYGFYNNDNFINIDKESISSYMMSYPSTDSSSEVLTSHYSTLTAKKYIQPENYSSAQVKDFRFINSQCSSLFDDIDSLYENLNVVSQDSFDFFPPFVLPVLLNQNTHLPLSFSDSNTSFSSLNTIYPIATRYISSDGTFFVERPPFQVQVDYKPAYASVPRKKMPSKTIWIPWTIFSFNPSKPSHNPSMYFSYKSLSSYEDNYLPTFLPNTFPDGRICFSNSLESLPMESVSNDPSSMYAYMINEFFAGSWNGDITNIYWSIFHYFYTPMVRTKNQEALDSLPNLSKLFNPSEETIHLSGILSNKSINKIYKNISQQSLPLHHLYSESSSVYFQYILLSILSTFTLNEVLDLQEELIKTIKDIYNNDNSIYKSNSSYNLHHCLKNDTFGNIVSKSSQPFYDYYSINNFINYTHLNRADLNSFSSLERNSNVIVVNVSNETIHPMRNAVRSVYSSHAFNSLSSAILSSDPSDIIIYDCEDSTIYTYHPKFSFHQTFLDVTKNYLDNNFHFSHQAHFDKGYQLCY